MCQQNHIEKEELEEHQNHDLPAVKHEKSPNERSQRRRDDKRPSQSVIRLQVECDRSRSHWYLNLIRLLWRLRLGRWDKTANERRGWQLPTTKAWKSSRWEVSAVLSIPCRRNSMENHWKTACPPTQLTRWSAAVRISECKSSELREQSRKLRRKFRFSWDHAWDYSTHLSPPFLIHFFPSRLLRSWNWLRNFRKLPRLIGNCELELSAHSVKFKVQLANLSHLLPHRCHLEQLAVAWERGSNICAVCASSAGNRFS